jgi:hypothetical protein
VAHIITPVVIDDVLYCVNEQGNMRTEVLLFDDGAFDSEIGENTAWVVANYDAEGSGALKFGTSCASEVTILLGTDGAPVLGNWAVYLNGAVYASGSVEDVPVEIDETIEIDLTPSPCGNIIYIEGEITSGADGNILGAVIIFPTPP